MRQKLFIVCFINPFSMYSVEKEYLRYMQELGGSIVSSENPKEDIRSARASLGITQEELGNLIALRRETVSRIENGIINPTSEFIRNFTKIMAIAKVFRDMHALDEVSRMRGVMSPQLNPNLLRSYLKVSLEDIKLIFEISSREYQKTRTKVLREI